MSAIDLCCCRQILRGQVSGYGPLSLCLTTDIRDHRPHPDGPRTRESAALPPLVPRMHLLTERYVGPAQQQGFRLVMSSNPAGGMNT
ncbi:hypothetical protein J3D46_002936 [Paenarthrobacter sp. A20]|nr:hypothetical protein [Paenarthrobacter sp. A20]